MSLNLNLKENRFLDLKSIPTGKRVKVLLTYTNNTARWLADQLGVDKDQISQVLLDRRSLSPKHIAKISKLLGVEIGVFIDEKQN